MVWWHHALSHYLNQFWPSSMMCDMVLPGTQGVNSFALRKKRDFHTSIWSFNKSSNSGGTNRKHIHVPMDGWNRCFKYWKLIEITNFKMKDHTEIDKESGGNWVSEWVIEFNGLSWSIQLGPCGPSQMAIERGLMGSMSANYTTRVTGTVKPEKVSTKFCGFSRQVVFHDRENEHHFVKTVPGKWSNLCVFSKTFPISLYRFHCIGNWHHFPIISSEKNTFRYFPHGLFD